VLKEDGLPTLFPQVEQLADGYFKDVEAVVARVAGAGGLTELAEVMERHHVALMSFATEVVNVVTQFRTWVKQPEVRKLLVDRQILVATEAHLVPMLWNIATAVIVHHRCVLLARDLVDPGVVVITPEQVCGRAGGRMGQPARAVRVLTGGRRYTSAASGGLRGSTWATWRTSTACARP